MSFDCIIQNGRIWNGDAFLPHLQDIAIADGKIAQIGNGLEGAHTVFDAKGAIVSCGLVDIHTHMKGCGNEYFGMPAETVCFPFGVTTAVEAWADRDGNALLENMLLDTCVFVGVGVVDNHADFTLTEKILPAYKKRAIGVKLCFDKSNPEIIDETPLRETCLFARKKGLKVLVHSTGSPVCMRKIFEILDKGDICTHIFHGGQNGVLDDDLECMAYARKKGIVLDNGMAGGVHTDFFVAKRAIEKGVLPDTISTDITKVSAFTRGGNYGMTLCMSIMRTLGMDESEIFKAVTSTPAKVIGKTVDTGCFQVGGIADIAIIRYQNAPFAIYDKQGNCVKDDYGYVNLLTLKNGLPVFRANM